MNNGTLIQYLVIERVICFNMLRLQELKQEQEFGICKYTRSRRRSLLSQSSSGVEVSKNRLRSPLPYCGSRDDQQPDPEQEPEYRSFGRSRSRNRSHF